MKSTFRILLISAALASTSAAQAEIGTTHAADPATSFEGASRGSIDVSTDGVKLLASVIDPNLIAPAIPEPATTTLLLGGLAVVAVVTRRRFSR